MNGNHPPGFPGFQSRLEAMAEELGGDWLANRAVEDSFSSALDLAMREGPENARRRADRDLSRRWAYRAEWVRATDADWDRAATFGENPFRNASAGLGEPVGGGTVDGFLVLWSLRSLVRFGRDPQGPAILLAKAWRFGRDETVEVSATDDGAALASEKGSPLRTNHRRCKAGNEAATLETFARIMGVRS